ncbi:hypothetical protein SAMN02745248_02000 [Hathewaya proteolytica DSM 3090]|uniref:DUF327 domain-containing protein n=1 Tax=Hathewaya proteolytica DSM 3090 TaxID=1121331 RepID=A0A1M6QFB8_9CLOT|nr:YaaR family protein [Hathewaya proteolytica]SHK18800.1 hypothetical protein SAMN02745248_02000 [Hathewaya proteolytica DSM 3090]
MEIKGVGRSAKINNDNKTISSKKDFSKNFSFARQQKSEEELKNLLKDIKTKGARLAISKSYADVKVYKNLIREYLNSVMEYMYSIKKDISFWQTQYYITVETINNKLEELTQGLLSEQRENLNIAATIDEITGLVVDMYK